MIKVNNLTKEFQSGDNKVIAVKGVSFEIPQGKFASIVGKSGSGKSTLLSLLGALDKPTSGELFLDDQDIAKMNDREQTKYRSREIGFVFQGYNLIPNLTALENVTVALEFGGVPASERTERAAKLLDEVGLDEDKQTRRPGKLSGGEQQRVAIARALANKPKLILADEPTGNLDSHTGKMIFNLLHKLSRSENTTIIAVTHDLGIAGKTDLTFKLKDGKLLT
jgi:putative ABC transport system ATP-binding protein